MTNPIDNEMHKSVTLMKVAQPGSMPDGVVRVRATDKSVDRDNDIVVTEGLDLEPFSKNPVVLLEHDRDKNIGRVVRAERREDGIIMDVKFNLSKPLAKAVYQEVKDGFRNAVSIGFKALEAEPRQDAESGWKITKSELVELSFVNIQSNRNAVVIQRNFDPENTDEIEIKEEDTPVFSTKSGEWIDDVSKEKLLHAAHTVLAILEHKDASFAKGSLRTHKKQPSDMERLLDEVTERVASELEKKGRELKRAWRDRIRDQENVDVVEMKRVLEREFYPQYKAILYDAAEKVWAEESERLASELQESGLLSESPEVGDRSRFDKSLIILLDSVTSEVLNRELGNLADQQAEITRSTPEGSDTPTVAIGLTTLAATTLASIASRGLAASLNAGRDRVIQAAEEESGKQMRVKRNEVLDKNTCEECERLDGTESVTGTRHFYKFSPPNFCLGRGRCRGFWDVVGEAKATSFIAKNFDEEKRDEILEILEAQTARQDEILVRLEDYDREDEEKTEELLTLVAQQRQSFEDLEERLLPSEEEEDEEREDEEEHEEEMDEDKSPNIEDPVIDTDTGINVTRLFYELDEDELETQPEPLFGIDWSEFEF